MSKPLNGRPRKWSGPTQVSTYRIPFDDWEWAKRKRIDLSALLASAIHKLQLEEIQGKPDHKARLVVALRDAGFNGERIGELLKEAK